MNAGLSCIYNTKTQRLTISNPVDRDAKNVTLTFEVDSFINPFSGRPQDGYVITTADAGDGIIDSSVFSSVGRPTVQVTEPTKFSQANVTRADNVTTVGELSTIKVNFRLDLPIDPTCLIQVKFPADMPVSKDISFLTLSGVINSSKQSPKNISLTANSVFYEAVCVSSDDLMAELSMWIFGVRNKGSLDPVAGSFEVSLFSVEVSSIDNIRREYPVATSGPIKLISPPPTPGTVTSFSIKAHDSQFLGQATRYRITLNP